MRCAVHDCHNCNDKKTGNRFRFYCFPKDKQIQKEWLDFCRRTNKVNVKTARICSHHFIADDIVRNIQFEMGLCKLNGYKLKPGTVPTVYSPCESGEVDEESLTNPPPLNKMEQNVQKDLSILEDIEVKTEIEINPIQYVEHCQDEDGNFKSLYLEREIKKEHFPIIEEGLSMLGDIEIKTEIEIDPSQYVEHWQDNDSNSNIHYLEREIDKDPLSINEVKEEIVSDDSVEIKTKYDSNELEVIPIPQAVKIFQCNECPKKFTKKYRFNMHERVHSTETPFHCDFCSKKFPHKSSLIRHILLHTGEASFHCDECPMKFAQEWNLIRHKRIHSGEKPFHCDECPKKFSQKSSLMRHNLGHSDQKSYQCDV